MYLNRKNIEWINALKKEYGADRFAQTNSRLNGKYLNHIRLYSTPEDKKTKTNYRELTTLEEIKAAFDELALGFLSEISIFPEQAAALNCHAGK